MENNYSSLSLFMFLMLITFAGYAMKLESDLLAAVSFNDVAKLKYILSQKVNVNYQNDSTGTALHFAVSCGRRELVKLLLDAGADVSLKNSDGESPLSSIAMHNPNILEIAAWLLAKNISKTSQDNEGRSLLHKACSGKIYGHTVSLVTVFLEYGISPNLQDCVGYTPLHFASAHCNPELVALLLRYKADPLIKAKNKANALNSARTAKPEFLGITLQAQEQTIALLEAAVKQIKQQAVLSIFKTKERVPQPTDNLLKDMPKDVIMSIINFIDYK